MCFLFSNTINGWLHGTNTFWWSSSSAKQKRNKLQGSQYKTKQQRFKLLIGNRDNSNNNNKDQNDSIIEDQQHQEHLKLVLSQRQLQPSNDYATFVKGDQYESNILISGQPLSLPNYSSKINNFTLTKATLADQNIEQHQAEEGRIRKSINMLSTTNCTNNTTTGNNGQQRGGGGSDGAGASDITADSLASVSPAGEGGPSRFRIRTANRRHLDFDPEYNLDEVNASGRSKWSGPFHFIQAADSQFGMIDSYIHKRPEPGWQDEIELCERLVKACNLMEPKPRFMIVCGDLADAWPATDVRRRQIVDFKRIFSKLDPCIPLVCVCGNHDIGDQPTMASITEYRGDFGDDYFYFTLNDVLFIVINSQFYQHRDYVVDYAKEQDEWLENMLAKCKLFKYSIIFEHIPWFLKNPDEEDDYFNIKKEVRLKWLEKFRDAGVTKIMCGHYHRNAGGWFDNMELVVTSAIGAQCGDDKSGVRIVKVLDRSIEHQYYNMQDIPKEINLA